MGDYDKDGVYLPKAAHTASIIIMHPSKPKILSDTTSLAIKKRLKDGDILWRVRAEGFTKTQLTKFILQERTLPDNAEVTQLFLEDCFEQINKRAMVTAGQETADWSDRRRVGVGRTLRSAGLPAPAGRSAAVVADGLGAPEFVAAALEATARLGDGEVQTLVAAMRSLPGVPPEVVRVLLVHRPLQELVDLAFNVDQLCSLAALVSGDYSWTSSPR